MFSALAAVCTVYCAVEIVLITLDYITLGNCQDLNITNLALKCWFFSMLQYWDINCKTVIISFYLLIIQLTVYYRTITIFTEDDKVVYQRVRWETWLASDNSWARRRLKHLSWRSQWIILCTLEQRIAVSCEISLADRCLFGLYTWLSTGSSMLCDECSLSLPGCRTIVPVLWILLSRLSMLLTLQPLSGNSLTVLRAPYCFDR